MLSLVYDTIQQSDGQTPGLESVEYLFIAITARSTLTWLPSRLELYNTLTASLQRVRPQ